MSITVKISGLENALKGLNADAINKNINSSLSKFGQNVQRDAISFAPVDEGFLRSSIFFDQPSNGSVTVGARADYAAYVEFGTRSFAANYVSQLPQEWKTFAAEFKGPGGGSFEQFVARLTEWVHRKGLGTGFGGKIGVTGTYSIKSRRRTGNKSTQEQQDRQAAYAIALKILRTGIKAQPYMKPAIDKNIPKLVTDIETSITKGQ